MGYIYSKEKLSVGDKITVWNEFYFDENTKYSLDRTSGVEAVVSKVVDTYYVEVSQQQNTYIITYFTIDGSTLSYTSETEKADLKKVIKNKIHLKRKWARK